MGKRLVGSKGSTRANTIVAGSSVGSGCAVVLGGTHTAIMVVGRFIRVSWQDTPSCQGPSCPPLDEQIALAGEGVRV